MKLKTSKKRILLKSPNSIFNFSVTIIEKLNQYEFQNKEYQLELKECKRKLEIEHNENIKLKEKVLSLESQSRRDNLRFDGFVEAKGETKSECEKNILNLLESVGLGISPRCVIRAHRIGPPSHYTSERPRTILVKFLHY